MRAPCDAGSGSDGIVVTHGPRSREDQPRRAASIAATSIFLMVIIASNARLAHRRRQPSLGQHARRDLPGHAPFVLAPAARALLAAVPDDRVPVAVGLGLIVGRDLEREGSLCLNAGPPLRPMQGTPATVNSTVSTSPFLPDGKSPGARWTAPTALSGKARHRSGPPLRRPSYHRQIVFFAIVSPRSRRTVNRHHSSKIVSHPLKKRPVSGWPYNVAARLGSNSQTGHTNGHV